MEILRHSIVDIFPDKVGEPHISIRTGAGGKLTYPVYSTDAGRYIRSVIFREMKKPLGKQAITTLQDTLAALAMEFEPRNVFVRIAHYDGNIYVDRGDKDGTVIRIGPEGYAPVSDYPVSFVRPSGFLPLPAAVLDCDGELFKHLLPEDEELWILVLAFIIAFFQPEGGRQGLIISAEQGAGKSFLADCIKKVLDPSSVNKAILPKNPHELMIQASYQALLCYDNVSRVIWDISDALCTIATGGGMMTRRYYTDNEARIFMQQRPFMLNGIGDIVDRPDLLSRAIWLELPAIPENRRRSERTLLAEFEAARPSFLGYVYRAVSGALRELDSVVLPESVRMADTAHWLTASEKAAGLPPGTFVKALQQNQTSLLIDQALNDPVLNVLQESVSQIPTRVYEGSFTDLHEDLRTRVDNFARWFPQTPASLSNKLRRLKPLAEKIGISIEFLPRTRDGARLRVTVAHRKERKRGKWPPEEDAWGRREF